MMMMSHMSIRTSIYVISLKLEKILKQIIKKLTLLRKSLHETLNTIIKFKKFKRITHNYHKNKIRNNQLISKNLVHKNKIKNNQLISKNLVLYLVVCLRRSNFFNVAQEIVFSLRCLFCKKETC